MKSQILLEINRVKEIMGLSPSLLNEQPIPFLKSIMKSSAETGMQSQLKKYLKPFADATSSEVDDVYELFQKKYNEALAKNSDTEIKNVFDEFFSVSTKDYADDLIEMYSKVAPQDFGREVIAAQFGNTKYKPIYTKYMNPATKATSENINSISNLLNDVRAKSSNIDPITATDQLAKDSLDDFAKELQTKINNYYDDLRAQQDDYFNQQAKAESEAEAKAPVYRPSKIDDIYDAMVEKGKKQKPPIKFPSKEKLEQFEFDLKTKFETPEDAMDYWIKQYGNDKRWGESVNDVLSQFGLAGKGVRTAIKIIGFGGVALILIGYIGYAYLVTDEGDAEALRQELVLQCQKLAETSVIRESYHEPFNQYIIDILYDNSVAQVEKNGETWTILVNGSKLPFKCNDKVGVGDVSLLTGGGEGGGNSKEYNQTLDDFKKFLVDNSLGTDDATNDTGGASGFWKANGKDYSYDATTKTFKEE